MAITVNEVTRVVFIPLADLTFTGVEPISGRNTYDLDTEWLRGQLKNYEASEAGGWRRRTHLRNDPFATGGTTIEQGLLIINGYTIEFEDGQHRVVLQGSNNNIADVAVVNQVQIIPTNSAGLSRVGTSGLTATEAADLNLAVKLMQADHFFDQSTGLLHYYERGTTTNLIPPKTVAGTGQNVDASILE